MEVYSQLHELYHASIKNFSANTCSSTFGGEKLTYSDFSDRVNKLTEIFAQAGLKSGDKVALLSKSMPNWGVAYFATVISSMVIVPILPDFTQDDVTLLIKHSEAKALIVSDKLLAKVTPEIRESLNIVLRTSDFEIICKSDGIIPNTEGYSVPDSDTIATIIYTSGTTSAPKGVMLSHYNLTCQIEMCYSVYPINEKDIFLSILPLSHTYECSIGMIYPFRRGSSVVYIDKMPTASVLLPILKTVRPTVMLVVPLIIEKIYRGKIKPMIDKSKFLSKAYSTKIGRKLISLYAGKQLYELFGGRLGFFGVGGSKLDTEVEQFMYDGKFPYAVGYGLTETAPLIAGMAPNAVRVGATGPILKGIDMRLDNVNENGEGELLVKGPNVMKGYYKNPEATAAAFSEDGYFRTKDTISIVDEYVYIKGRIGNMIVGPSGENIYPEEIEFVINSYNLVDESIVKSDESGHLTALVHFDKKLLEEKYNVYKEQLSEKMEEIKKDLLKYINERVATKSRITKIVEIKDDFEKTPTQKIKRFLYNAKGKIDTAKDKIETYKNSYLKDKNK